MEYSSISALLEKYWEGETSLEEEALLRTFFSSPHAELPDDLREAAPLFQYFHSEATKVWEEPVAKVVPLSPFRHWMKYAAVLLVGIGVGYAVKQQQYQERAVMAAMKADGMEDPQQAYAATKKALQLLAKNLHKGTSQMEKLSYFNEATDIVTGKD
ncbi:hypothetical protein [Chitinophaga nivalis]|uniref:Anti-sigma factor n=1 Tax=Chitinophaga nivalis TaxID=2991709 RepID=A0ABT3IL49_9BACT|nr:hypothetical protein [Chitinophaga nivalis]MCW3465613.1 hypothetical protein [Chitinophaga nivalis]MCW3484696.1 hypothetical protein [Chitinophaga nivalis]